MSLAEGAVASELARWFSSTSGAGTVAPRARGKPCGETVWRLRIAALDLETFRPTPARSE
jgi:hypothetical protein